MPQHGMYSTYMYLLMCVVLILKTQVSEINLYITEVESDVMQRSCISYINWFMVRPEVSQVCMCSALLKKLARGVLGLRGVTARGVLWQHIRVFS